MPRRRHVQPLHGSDLRSREGHRSRGLVDVGEFCSFYQAQVLRELPFERIESDKIWALVCAKQHRAKRDSDGDISV